MQTTGYLERLANQDVGRLQNAAPKDSPKELQIPLAMKYLEGNIENLNRGLQELENRLKPVLTIEPVIEEQAIQVQRAINKIQDILHLLEL